MKIVRQQLLKNTGDLTILHRKIEHNEKVYCIPELGFYIQGQGQNQVRGQIVPETVSSQSQKCHSAIMSDKRKFLPRISSTTEICVYHDACR